MGFFSKKKKQTTRNENKPLESYTAQIRETAPWAFASLDPTATLAAMRQKPDSAQTKLLGGIGGDFGKELQKQADMEGQEVDASNAALQRIEERQKSGKFLTSEETDFINTSLDKAFEYAQTVGMKNWQLGAQSLAGRQGLRTSDTPVAKPAMESLRDLQLGLGSQRAQMGLASTLDFSKNQQDFDINLMSTLKNLGMNRWATRQGFNFGGGMQGVSGVSSKTTNTMSAPMSGFQKVMAGFQMGNAAMDFGSRIGAAFAGMPGGGGAGASNPMSMMGGGGSTGYGAGVSYN